MYKYGGNDREPTITDIKGRLSDLNQEINIFAKEHIVVSDWSIGRMKKPFYIKKYNSSRYPSSGRQPYQNAINWGWWGDSHASRGHNWGRNLFPDDRLAWWIGTDSYKVSWRFGSNVPDYEKRYLYYLYDAPENMTVSIYKIGSWNSLKVNGQSVNFTYDAGHPNPGQNGSFNLLAGKNVFEVTVTAGLPSSGTIMYVYENNDILFRTGDPGWGVSETPVPDYTLISSSNIVNKKERENMDRDILFKINDINTMLKNIDPKKKDNITFKDQNKEALLAELNQLKRTFYKLKRELKKPVLLEGNYEVSKLKTDGIYSNFILFILIAIFVIGSLVFIVINPEVGNLDMFMLGLAILIIIYYMYEYYTMKKRIGKKTK